MTCLKRILSIITTVLLLCTTMSPSVLAENLTASTMDNNTLEAAFII